jgi:rloA
MLLRLKVKNYLSFYEENVFDMFPNPRRTTFQNHIYKDRKIPLLKQAAIYGANGSGKSNLLYTMRFLKKFATEKKCIEVIPPALNKFRLKEEENKKPISISIEFFHQDIYFIYNVAINDTNIEKEELYISGLGEKEDETIFKRNNNEFWEAQSTGEELKTAINKMLESNPLSSLLSLNKEFPILKDKRVEVAYDWFKNYVKVLSMHRWMSGIISLMAHEPKLLEFTNHLISQIGLGIKKIDIKEDNLNEFLVENDENSESIRKKIKEELEEGQGFSQRRNDKVLFAIEKENGEAIMRRFLFEQIGINNFIGKLEYECQSDGTARLINLIPALYDLKNKHCVYLIDELECGIHPILILRLMQFFAEEETLGQLIYTTHETMLLNQQELMRPDEVWFVEKQHGCSHIYSLNDFKEHNTINIVNGYLEGRYGAIPFIGNLE